MNSYVHTTLGTAVDVSAVFLFQLTLNKTADFGDKSFTSSATVLSEVELLASRKMLSCRKIVYASVDFYRGSSFPFQPSESAGVRALKSTILQEVGHL